MNHHNFSRLVSLLVMLLLVATAGAQDRTSPDNTDVERTSDQGHFVISYESGLQPIVINQIHAWTIHVESSQGERLDDAQIEVIGGMPLHDHGLPTLPQSTTYLGDGNYLIEGMKFHMSGWWEVTVSIVAGDVSDTVIFDLVL